MSMLDNIKAMLIRHEGIVCNVYLCSEGYKTIGVGRCLDTNGITRDEANYLLENDIKRVEQELNENFGAWRTFPEKARMVCIDMTFQMGIVGFCRFIKTKKLMEDNNWLEASEEILRSRYATQTPTRAAYNSRQLALCQQNQQKTI